PLGVPRTILRGVCGRFRTGEVTAVMGPSGAGKSTLLECLTGRRHKGLSGEMKLTGSRASSPLKLAMVPQHDFMLPHFTVKETLVYASRIKNHSGTSTSGSLTPGGV